MDLFVGFRNFCYQYYRCEPLRVDMFEDGGKCSAASYAPRCPSSVGRHRSHMAFQTVAARCHPAIRTRSTLPPGTAAGSAESVPGDSACPIPDLVTFPSMQ